MSNCSASIYICILLVCSLVSGETFAAACAEQKEVENVGAFFKRPVNKSNFIEVDRGNRVAALKRLGDRTFQKIDPLTAEGLAGIPVSFGQGDQSIYLARVQRSTESGAISVFLDGSRLLVIHGDLGSEGCGEILESAIILSLDANIEQAFSSTSISR